jgi:hypothetical protein
MNLLLARIRRLSIGAPLTVVSFASMAQPPDVVTSDQYNNTAMGSNALLADQPSGVINGSDNTGAGSDALLSNTTGSSNTAFGALTLYSNTTGRANTAVGSLSLYFNTGSQNTAIGAGALYSNTNGIANTAVGLNALVTNLSGGYNVAVGMGALGANETGAYNVALGYNALLENTASYNTAVGYQSLYGNNSGSSNTATGWEALFKNADGGSNAAFGTNTLYSNFSGANNTGSGAAALYYNSTGSNNTGLGYQALNSLTGGNSNIAIGSNAGFNLSGTNSNNIDLANLGVAGDNGIIRIGISGTQVSAFLAGVYSSQVTGCAVYVNSAGQLGCLASSERFKFDVAPMRSASAKLGLLRHVTFRLRADPDGAVQYGLLAEEVAEVYPELMIRDDAGRIQGLRYEELTPMLINELQRQQKQIEALQQLTQVVASQDRQIREMQLQLAQWKEIRQQLAALGRLAQPKESTADAAQAQGTPGQM